MRAQAEYNRDVRLAWHVASLGRVEKLPRLDTLLIRPPQTVAEQRAVVEALSAQLGIRTRKVRWITQLVA